MSNTSNKVVEDYLNSMFMDLTMSDPELIVESKKDYIAQDSILTGYQMVPCMDPFSFMEINPSISKAKIWLAYLSILNLSNKLPAGHLKQYCLRQCQTLSGQLLKRGVY